MLRRKFVKLTLFLIALFFFTSCTNKSDTPPLSPVKVSGYTSSNASATSNVFVLKEVTSEFSVGDIVTFGDSKKEYEIGMVEALKKSESGNFQEIVLYKGVGFVITPGIKVSVVRRSTLDNYPERCNLGR